MLIMSRCMVLCCVGVVAHVRLLLLFLIHGCLHCRLFWVAAARENSLKPKLQATLVGRLLGTSCMH